MQEFKINKDLILKQEDQQVAVFQKGKKVDSYEYYDDIIDYLKEELEPKDFLKKVESLERKGFLDKLLRLEITKELILSAIKAFLTNIEDGERLITDPHGESKTLFEVFFDEIYRFKLEYNYSAKLESKLDFDEDEKEAHMKVHGEKFLDSIMKPFYKPVKIINGSIYDEPSIEKTDNVWIAMDNLKMYVEKLRRELKNFKKQKKEIDMLRKENLKKDVILYDEITDHLIHKLLSQKWKSFTEIASRFKNLEISDIAYLHLELKEMERRSLDCKIINNEKCWKVDSSTQKKLTDF